MDKVTISTTIAIIATILLVFLISLGIYTQETKIIKTSILDPKTGEYYQGYKEEQEYHPFITVGIIIGFIIMACSGSSMLWWMR